jgi:hypothetical protein
MATTASDLDQHLKKFEARLPTSAARAIGWLRQPSSSYVRVPLAAALILSGFVGFLPILGFWMIPLGLLLIAKDIPFLRGPLVGVLTWAERKWPGKNRRNSRRKRQ